MNEVSELQSQIKDNVKRARKRLANVSAKQSLMKKPEGKVVEDYISERIAQLVASITSNNPADREKYLTAHAGIRELRLLSASLHATSDEEINAINVEIETYEQQLESLSGE